MKLSSFSDARRLCSVLGAVAVTLSACSAESGSPAKKVGVIADAAAEAGARISDTVPVDTSDPKNDYLRAVASLSVGCTGTFIDTSENDDAPAYLLTAARCLSQLPDTSFFDVSIGERQNALTLVASFDLARDASGKTPSANYVQTAYGTLKGLDLALIELDTTIGRLKAAGVEPLPLADAAPAAGAPIEMIGIRSQPDGSAKQARRARCAEGARRTNLVELNGYFYDEHRNDCAALGGGSTGGPVLDESGKLYGLFNTHFDGAEPAQPCYSNYPCEVGAGPERGVEGANYVVDVTALASCFDAAGRFELKTGCNLDAGVGARPGNRLWRIVSATYGEPPVPSTWNMEVESSPGDTHYRYKVGSVQSVDCRSNDGYSEPISLDDAELAELPVPSEAGLYALCLLTGSGEVDSASWQSRQHPTVIVKKVMGPTAVDPEASQVTSEQAFALGKQVVDAYRDVATAHDARFLIGYGGTTDSNFAPTPERVWTVQIGLDYRRQGISPDVFTFTICHETGHGIGGFPFDSRNAAHFSEGLATGLYGTVVAAEEQADYFAAKECLPRVWAEQRATNAKFRATVSDYAKTRCDAVWQNPDDQNLCYRIAAAAVGFGLWTTPTGELKLETPDTSQHSIPNYSGYASEQGRVDTIFHGALCPTKFRSTSIPGLVEPFDQVGNQGAAVEAAAAPDSCIDGPGARPDIWFIPNFDQTDCSGIPDVGKCVVQDGHDAVQNCDPFNGISNLPCGPLSTCQVDEFGPTCVASPSQP